MTNGFLYPIFNFVVRLLFYCNLVEYFKFAAQGLVRLASLLQGRKAGQREIIGGANLAIDVYQVFKFVVLSVFWISEYKSDFAKYFTYYLIASNLFSYFYYHVWGSIYQRRIDRDALNRRFLNTLIAISFYLLCYAYLYQIHYNESIQWPNSVVDPTNALYLSVANAFTLTYGGFVPLTQEIRLIFLGELLNTFLFFTVIVSNSIPNHAESEN